MGFFSSLFKRLRPPELDDEFFGRLVYMKMPQGRVSYWEAKRVFPPTGREVELFIDAPAPLATPNETQRNFFLEVAHDYHGILAAIEPLLRSELETWIHKPIERPFADEFILTSFSIPVPSEMPPDWEMSFDSVTDPNHLFSVTNRGRVAQNVTIDG